MLQSLPFVIPPILAWMRWNSYFFSYLKKKIWFYRSSLLAFIHSQFILCKPRPPPKNIQNIIGIIRVMKEQQDDCCKSWEWEKHTHTQRQNGTHVETRQETWRSPEAELGREIDGRIETLHMLLYTPHSKSIALVTLGNTGVWSTLKNCFPFDTLFIYLFFLTPFFFKRCKLWVW